MGDVTWCVVGGEDKGGIIVREGLDTASPVAPARLSTGALLKQLEFTGERLRYQRLSGTGPDFGWVSAKIPGPPPKELVARASELWEVVGGADKGGIVVREGQDKASPLINERLSTRALVRELRLEGDRLNYERITGTGPARGWVSTALPDKDLLVRVVKDSAGKPPEPEQDFSELVHFYEAPQKLRDPPLEIQMSNAETGFSYEGLPPWVPHAAAMSRMRLEGKRCLPPDEPPLERLGRLKPLGPFKKILPKKLKEVFVENLPGGLYGLSFPHTCEQMDSEQFGPEFLTKAFHAAGTLPEDNRVTKITRCEELPIKGFDTAGGAAMKMFIDVEYLKPDPDLHTSLLSKYSYSPLRGIAGVTAIGQNDDLEVLVSLQLTHLFPMRTPKIYWGDICRETSVFMIIMECVPYAKRGQKCGPYEILPGCGKYQDYMLPNSEEFYMAIFRAKGQLAGWDKCGLFDSFFGPAGVYNELEYLGGNPRPTQPKHLMEVTRQQVGITMDKGIDFLVNYCKNMLSPDVTDMSKLQKVKAELVEMGPYLTDLGQYYQMSNSAYVTAAHVNLQADNAYFWRDERGELTAGVLDWGGFARHAVFTRFLGCLSGAEPEVLLEYEDGILQCFLDEYERCGGPKIDLEEARLHFHLGFITNVYDCNYWLDRQVFKETPKEEFLGFKSVQDEVFQGRFYTRCGAATIFSTYGYYLLRGDLKATFDKWAAGPGKPFLTKYE